MGDEFDSQLVTVTLAVDEWVKVVAGLVVSDIHGDTIPIIEKIRDRIRKGN